MHGSHNYECTAAHARNEDVDLDYSLNVQQHRVRLNVHALLTSVPPAACYIEMVIHRTG